MSDDILLNDAKRLLARVHGMPWVVMDVDKALADKVDGPVLRELLVLVPYLVDALDDIMTRSKLFECRECGVQETGQYVCKDCTEPPPDDYTAKVE